MLFYRQIHLEVNSGLRGTGTILIFKMNLTTGMETQGVTEGTAAVSVVSWPASLWSSMYVHQQSCYS